MPSKHQPPAINNYEEFDKNLKGYIQENEKLVLFFDYDGTLVPIISDPNKTEMLPFTETTLHKFAENSNIFLGVISGRGLKDVKEKIGINNITYGGNHGIEIENSDGSRSDFQLPDELKVNYKKMVEELFDAVNKSGAFVEDKNVSLTYHYRNVAEELREPLRSEAIRIVKKYGFIANHAHCAIEVKPPINWNKGEAALLILNKNFGNDWPTKTKVIFAGDDTTDEDAMKLLQGTGAKTFRIAADPKFETYADFRLPSQNLIPELIKWIDSHYS